MTELLYQTDSYLREFSGSIDRGEPAARRVALDRSAFYPGGGGQPCDTGSLSWSSVTHQVTQIRKEGEVVWHYLTAGVPLPPPGQAVTGSIDWPRRYALMRTHTAMHVLCGVVWRDFGALVTGGNMEPLQGRMDFEFASMHGDLVAEIEHRCNTEIAAGRELKVRIVPRAQAFEIPDLIRTRINLLPAGIPEVRTVEIVGLDLQADGGTHVANTREVGSIRITDYKSKGAINKRIYIALE